MTSSAPDPSRMLVVAVDLPVGQGRDRLIDYLGQDPLGLPWRVQIAGNAAGGAHAGSDVRVVPGAAVRCHDADFAGVPPAPARVGRRPAVVAVLDSPSEADPTIVGDWCLVLADDPLDDVGRAIEAAALGGVWLSGRVAWAIQRASATRSRGAAAMPPRVTLTAAEQETFTLLRGGLSNRQIAAYRHVSVTTVKWHVRSVLRKYGCRTRQELIGLLFEETQPHGSTKTLL